jgi:hypothetical protein
MTTAPEHPEPKPSPTAESPHTLGYQGPTAQQDDAPWPVHLSFAVVAATLLACALLMAGGVAAVGLYFIGPFQGFIAALLAVLFGGAVLAFQFGLKGRFRRASAVGTGLTTLVLSLPLAWASWTWHTDQPDWAVTAGLLAAIAAFCAVVHLLWAARLSRSRSRRDGA